jgi:hypothetical protein
MPLRIESDITIWSPPPTPPPTDQPSASPSENTINTVNFAEAAHSLPVPLIRQEKRNWCWAACVQMVMHYFEQISVSQCEVVSRFFDRDSCADPDSFDTARDPGEIEDIFLRQQPSVMCRHQPGTVSFERIQSEIDERRRPLGVAILWFRPDGEQRGGHLILVKGWRLGNNDRPFVKVNDPWYNGIGEVPFSQLLRYYGPPDDGVNGEWRHTWTGIRR